MIATAVLTGLEQLLVEEPKCQSKHFVDGRAGLSCTVTAVGTCHVSCHAIATNWCQARVDQHVAATGTCAYCDQSVQDCFTINLY